MDIYLEVLVALGPEKDI